MKNDVKVSYPVIASRTIHLIATLTRKNPGINRIRILDRYGAEFELFPQNAPEKGYVFSTAKDRGDNLFTIETLSAIALEMKAGKLDGASALCQINAVMGSSFKAGKEM